MAKPAADDNSFAPNHRLAVRWIEVSGDGCRKFLRHMPNSATVNPNLNCG